MRLFCFVMACGTETLRWGLLSLHEIPRWQNCVRYSAKQPLTPARAFVTLVPYGRLYVRGLFCVSLVVLVLIYAGARL
jgi:hypothetical protein